MSQCSSAEVACVSPLPSQTYALICATVALVAPRLELCSEGLEEVLNSAAANDYKSSVMEELSEKYKLFYNKAFGVPLEHTALTTALLESEFFALVTEDEPPVRSPASSQSLMGLLSNHRVTPKDRERACVLGDAGGDCGNSCDVLGRLALAEIRLVAYACIGRLRPKDGPLRDDRSYALPMYG